MATITTIASSERGGIKTRVVSAAATLATPDLVINLDDAVSGLNIKDYAHHYLSVKLFTSIGQQLTGSAGIFAILVTTEVNGLLEPPPQATILATALRTVDFRGPIIRVQVTEDGNLAGGDLTTWRIEIVSYRS